MYKNGMTKSRFKAHLKNFWKNNWTIVSPMAWVHSLNTSHWNRVRVTYKLISAIDKLVLEKKCTKDEGENLKKMLGSEDQENQFLAITVMANLKPKQFLKT